MRNRWRDNEPSAYDDDWEDIPSAGALPKWGAGVALAIGLAIYGVRCIVTGHATISGRYQEMNLQGASAAALGLGSLSLALFLHCHYFWGNIFHLSACAVVGKILSLLLLIASLGYLLWHVGVLGGWS